MSTSSLTMKPDAIGVRPRVQPVRRTPNATYYPFYLGGVATSLASTCTHPLDLAKVRMQTLPGRPGLLTTVMRTVEEGGVRGLFDGLSAAWFRGMTYSLVRFQAYFVAKDHLAASGKVKSTIVQGVLAGMAAGVFAGVLSNPGGKLLSLYIVLIRMQADRTKALAERFNYRNVLHGLYKITVNEGPVELFRGLNTTLLRAVLTNVGQLASYDVFKAAMLSTEGAKDTPLTHFLASFAAGTVATTLSQPADVIRSRLMAAGGPKQSALRVTTDLIRAEGVQSLFRGWLPAWYRITPQTVLTFLFLEQLRRLVDLYREVELP
ncbi:dicarboxylic acid transporter [Calocera viscosa TUFC12733]|uniref:Dicarboxylic acid transporter n=1 Tax=Calocera viscosa (strain TUFC12733) TaxID=1330018 RepID=A0A167FS27_CALVF|nr:dicarboxylic acid transporter [Calocera viscosa TUFC12733]